MADLQGVLHAISRQLSFPGTMPYRRSTATYSPTIALAAGALLALTACTADSALMSADPLASEHPLWMVPISQTDRWAVNMAVDHYGMGGSPPHGGGGAAACCYPSPKDWNKPVTVHWEWDTVVDPKTKVVPPTEPHSMIVHFPPGGPAKDDRYLCLIVRDRNTAELAFARSRTRCATE